VDDIHHVAGQQPSAVAGTIKIAISTVPSEWLLPELLVGFKELYPEIRESVSVSDSAEAIDAVESGAAEIGLVGEFPHSARLCAKTVARDELVFVVGPDHEFVGLERVELEDLKGQSFIVREPKSGSRRCVERALSKAGLSTTDLTLSMEVNSNEAIRAAVERGVGVAFLSARAIAREIEDERLFGVAIRGVRAVRHLYLITDPKRMPTRVVRAFLDYVDEARDSPSNMSDA
jgi:DNA-binding transcriptional LysR family regulator